MEFYEVLERRRTIRDFSDKIVTDEVLEKILSAAFKAPTNDHLRQFEFIVVRGRENIARLVAPVTENPRNIQQAGLEAAEAMDEDERAMFVDALPKQRRMLIESDCLVLPFFRQKVSRSRRASSVPSDGSKFAQLFRLGVGGGRKYPAGGDG